MVGPEMSGGTRVDLGFGELGAVSFVLQDVSFLDLRHAVGVEWIGQQFAGVGDLHDNRCGGGVGCNGDGAFGLNTVSDSGRAWKIHAHGNVRRA